MLYLPPTLIRESGMSQAEAVQEQAERNKNIASLTTVAPAGSWRCGKIEKASSATCEDSDRPRQQTRWLARRAKQTIVYRNIRHSTKNFGT